MLIIPAQKSEWERAAPEWRPFSPCGAAKAVLYDKSPELLLSGPAGTGKTRANLEKLYAVAQKYPRSRCLIVRKTRASCTQSVLVTWENKVVPQGHPCLKGASRAQRTEYEFPNGSIVAVGGLDNPTRIMSTEWDIIYIAEAIELTEEEWESLSSRLRNNALKHEITGETYHQIIADTNPAGPNHWLYQRCQRKACKMLLSHHEDNPELWDAHHLRPTTHGAAYLARLDNLTGPRKARLRYGVWAQSEGVVYENWEPGRHRIMRRQIKGAWWEWPRMWAVDFGFTNPFVWQEWLLAPDGEMYRYREIYHTRLLVEDAARLIKKIAPYRPQALICDHDAEDRATLERHLGIRAQLAYKVRKSPGIQACEARLRADERGKARMYFIRDGLQHAPDEDLLEKKLPTCTEEEFDGYIWNLTGGQKKGEEPIDRDNHGMDAMRYGVSWVDKIHLSAPQRFRPRVVR